MVAGLVVVVGSAWVGIAVVGPVSPVRMSAPQWLQVLMCAWRAWRGVGLGALLMSDPFGGAWWWCWELVEEVGLFFGRFSGHGGSFGVREKLCHPAFRLVSRFWVTQVTQGSICMAVTGVCARVCVCHLLTKVVSLVSPISTLTR